MQSISVIKKTTRVLLSAGLVLVFSVLSVGLVKPTPVEAITGKTTMFIGQAFYIQGSGNAVVCGAARLSPDGQTIDVSGTLGGNFSVANGGMTVNVVDLDTGNLLHNTSATINYNNTAGAPFVFTQPRIVLPSPVTNVYVSLSGFVSIKEPFKNYSMTFNYSEVTNPKAVVSASGGSPSPTTTWSDSISGGSSNGCGNFAGGPVNPPATPSYTITCGPTPLTVTAGNSTSANITVTPANGFAAPVTASGSVASVPPGAATPPVLSFTNNPTTNPYATPIGVTLTTTGATTPGNYVVSLSTTDGGSLTQSCNLALTVSPYTGNFAIWMWRAAPPMPNGAAGAIDVVTSPAPVGQVDTADFVVYINCNNGYSGPTTLLSSTSTFTGTNGAGPGTYFYQTSAPGTPLASPQLPCDTDAGYRVRLNKTNQVIAGELSTPGTGSVYKNLTVTASGPVVGSQTSGPVQVAVYNQPTASLTINGAATATIAAGNSATLAWNSVATNSGNSCTVSNAWSGTRAVTGTESTGVMNTPGTYTYSVQCAGYNGMMSNVGTAVLTVSPAAPSPDFTLNCSPTNVNVTQGGTATVFLSVASVSGGFSSPVTFTHSVSPSPAGAPTVTYTGNPTVSPYATPTTATVAASGATAPGSYVITFTGTSGALSHPCNSTINLTVGGAPAPNAFIAVREGTNFNNFSNGNQTTGDPAITIPYNTAATVEWNSFNATSCVLSYESPRGSGSWTTVTVPGNPVNSYSLPGGNVASGNLVQTRNYRVICTGPGGTSAPAVAGVDVSAPPINPPSSVSLAVAASCGQIDVSWTAPVSGTFDGYRVYRSLDGSSWQQVGGDLPSGTLSFTDTSPLSPALGNYYAVATYRTSDSAQSSYAVSTPSSVQPVACSGDLSLSDKDLVAANGQAGSSPSAACNANSDIYQFPSGRVFKVGDTVTFRVCVKNSGPVTVTGVSLADTSTNLSNFRSFSFTTGCKPVVNTPLSTSFTATIGDLTSGKTCSFTYDATVTAPANPDPTLYRFQNVAVVQGTAAGNTLTQTMRTPLYPFATTNGTPTRGEVAP